MKKLLIVETIPSLPTSTRPGSKRELRGRDRAGWAERVLPDSRIPSGRRPAGFDVAQDERDRNLEKIRAQPQFLKLPIIVFTNAYVPNMINESFQAAPPRSSTRRRSPRGKSSRPSTMPLSLGQSRNQRHASRRAPAFRSASAPRTPLRGSAVRFSGRRPRVRLSDRRGRAQATAAETASDTEFQSELVKTFLEGSVETVRVCAARCRISARPRMKPGVCRTCFELYRKVHALTGGAGIAALHKISQMAAAWKSSSRSCTRNQKHQRLHFADGRPRHRLHRRVVQQGRGRRVLGANPIIFWWWTTRFSPAAPSPTRWKKRTSNPPA